jgi:hypothetical protein
MDQPNKFDQFKQFDQAKVSLLEAKVARLTAEQRDLVDAQDLSNEATMRGAVSRHTIIRGMKLQVGPPEQTDPPLTQVHEGDNSAPLADALRVQYVNGAYRLCLDVDRLYIGSALAGVFRPLADFFAVGGESDDALGLRLEAVYTENAYVGAKAVGELPTQEHNDRKVYPMGAYALDDGGGI